MFLAELILTFLINNLNSRPLLLSLILIIFISSWGLNILIGLTLGFYVILSVYFEGNTTSTSTTHFKKRFRHLNKYSLPESTSVVMQKRFKFIFLMITALSLMFF